MRKLSLFGLFAIVMVFVSQLENLQDAMKVILSNGIPPAFYLTMALSLLIFVSLFSSLKYIRRIGKTQ